MSDNNQSDGVTSTDGSEGWLLLECEAGGGGQGHFVRLGYPFERKSDGTYNDDGPTAGNADEAQKLWNASKENLKLETIPHIEGVDGPGKDATEQQKKDHDYWNVGKAWRDYSGHNRISLTKGNYLHIIGGTYRRVMVGDEQEQLGTEGQPVKLREDINFIMTEREKKYIGTKDKDGSYTRVVEVHGRMEETTTVHGEMRERKEVRGGSKHDVVDVHGGVVSSLSVAGGVSDTTSVIGPILEIVVAPLKVEISVGGVVGVFVGKRREFILGQSDEVRLSKTLKVIPDETKVSLKALHLAVSDIQAALKMTNVAVSFSVVAARSSIGLPE